MTSRSSNNNQPSVPSLYFETHRINNAERNNTNTSPELPSDVLYHCLASYANWGDLAKLSCVQKSWSNIVADTANQSLESQWELATALLDGECGLEKSPERAIRILKEISRVDIDESTGEPMYVVPARRRKEGEESNNNDTENEKIYNKPQQQQQQLRAAAMKKIADCYLEGAGVPRRDAAVAVKWMEAACFVGDDVRAARDLAAIYETGDVDSGVDIDPTKAFEWHERAANLGSVDSMAEVGLCYELGCGAEQSDEEALDWYTKAAELGHATAKFSVGEIFEEARGVPRSETEACMWYYSAAVDGCRDSKFALRRLYSIARIVVPGVAAIINEE